MAASNRFSITVSEPAVSTLPVLLLISLFRLLQTAGWSSAPWVGTRIRLRNRNLW